MAAHLRHLKLLSPSRCRCRFMSAICTFEYEPQQPLGRKYPTIQRLVPSNGISVKADPPASWARVNWMEVERDLSTLHELTSLMASTNFSDFPKEKEISCLKRLTSPKDLIRIAAEVDGDESLSSRTREKVQEGLRMLEDARSPALRRQTSSVLFSPSLPTREALLALPDDFFSEVEREALLRASPGQPAPGQAVPSPGVESDEEKKKRAGRPSPEQLQHICDVLADDLPNVFTRPMNFRIYHPDVIFENHIRNVRTQGVGKYIQQVALLRTVGHLKFAYVRFEILKITKHAEDGTVRVRWRIRGMSGWKVLSTFWRYKIFKYKQMMEKQQELWHDGFSIFYVGGDGLVQKHIATRLMPDDDGREETAKRGIGPALAALMGVQLAPKQSLLDGLSGTGLFTFRPQPTAEVTELSSVFERKEGCSDDPNDWSVLMFPLEELR